jgi:SWI/SNF-related matrix-associated actin-dependent regulator of chromatin subfamily A protein 2/4
MPPSDKPQIFSTPQIQQLKAQIMAYRCLSRTQPLLPGLVSAVHGRRPEPSAQGPQGSQIPMQRPGAPPQQRPSHVPQQLGPSTAQPLTPIPPTVNSNGPVMPPPPSAVAPPIVVRD